MRPDDTGAPAGDGDTGGGDGLDGLARPARGGRRGRSGDALQRFDDLYLEDEPETAPAPTVPPPSFRDRELGGPTNPLDNIDHLFRRTSSRVWLGVLALVAVCAAGVAWTTVATVSVTTRGQAFVVPPDGIFAVGEGVAGRVVAVAVAPGDRVDAGDAVAEVALADGSRVQVPSPVSGEVVAVDARAGDAATGAALARVVPVTERPTAVALFGAADVSALAVGQRADLVVGGFAPGRYGSVRARVASIGTVPTSSARLLQLAGDANLAAALGQLGPVYEVLLDVETADTPSGLRWTRGDGPDGPVPLGALAAVTVTVDEQSLLEKAFR